MIKVTVKELETMTDHGFPSAVPVVKVKEHKDATWAMVHNGVLSLYPESASGEKEFISKAVAGYEPGAWVGWEKV